jgi:hypothetical protein
LVGRLLRRRRTRDDGRKFRRLVVFPPGKSRRGLATARRKGNNGQHHRAKRCSFHSDAEPEKVFANRVFKGGHLRYK